MEKDIIIHGIRVAGYEFIPEKIKELIKTRCIDRGMNYIDFAFGQQEIPEEYFLDIAKFLKENKVYFDVHFKHPTRNPGGTFKTACGYTEETALAMKEIAGEYFLSHVMAELGSEFGCYAAAYGERLRVNATDNDSDNMRDASLAIKKKAKTLIDAASVGGKIPVTVIEATGLLPYVVNSGLSYPYLEAMCGKSDIMIPLLRATAKANNCPYMATYIAHEWYGGVRAFDPLKMLRLRMMYDFGYMSGVNIFTIESGDEELHAHDTPRTEKKDGDRTYIEYECEYDHPMCRKYRDVMAEFAEFVNHDDRPKGGP
ncbi:MAG: hypothetical protein IIV97_02760, partial [Oscillospiraceae bacterium]|nr:hypothetical protein [Oscillospiraceae bacterium]